MTRADDPRRLDCGTALTMVVCGGASLLGGLAAGAVSIWDPPNHDFEATMALIVAIGGTSSGVLFLSTLVGAQGVLWRWLGWLPSLTLLVFGLVLLLNSATAAQRSTRIGAPLTALLLGGLIAWAGLYVSHFWWRSWRRRSD